MRCVLTVVALLSAVAPHTAIASPPTANDIAAADNAFGFRLLAAVQTTTPQANVILSPIGAALDLSMVLNGAEDQTRHEILAALALSGSDIEAINAANAQLIKLTRAPAKGVDLSVVDSLWVDSRRAKLRPDYVKRVQAAYDAEIADLDFAGPGASGRINSWASRETHGAIPKVIDRIDPAELALLLNAVYFKGIWTHKFDKAKTQPRDFKLEGGSTKQVPRMSQAARFDYFETPDMQAIRLPFGDGNMDMLILLPAISSSLGDLETKLTPEHWRSWQGQFAARPGTLELPRFELKSRHRLNEALQSLGMRRAFEPGAQLAGMLTSHSGQGPPQQALLSSVLQLTYWKVDEEGAEAAAVTTTQIRATVVARPTRQFHMIVDRPFFCAIDDRRSGALLFVGSIYDPTS
jgi:serine protease inhibitor